MVGDHIAQAARAVVIASAPFDSKRLRHSYLHMIDVATIPDRLEDSVGKTEHQNVLNGLLAQVVIDAVDLALLQYLANLRIQRFRGFQIRAEWLFDDDAPPAPVIL